MSVNDKLAQLRAVLTEIEDLDAEGLAADYVVEWLANRMRGANRPLIERRCILHTDGEQKLVSVDWSVDGHTWQSPGMLIGEIVRAQQEKAPHPPPSPLVHFGPPEDPSITQVAAICEALVTVAEED